MDVTVGDELSVSLECEAARPEVRDWRRKSWTDGPALGREPPPRRQRTMQEKTERFDLTDEPTTDVAQRQLSRRLIYKLGMQSHFTRWINF
jgi:hypothetical protein